MFHIPTRTFAGHAERIGFVIPEPNVTLTPNVPKPRSRGRLWLTSPDPRMPPAIDFAYLTDPDDYDLTTLVDGVRVARRVAATEPMRSWIPRSAVGGHQGAVLGVVLA